LIAHTSICDGSNQIATPAAGPAASVHFRASERENRRCDRPAIRFHAVYWRTLAPPRRKAFLKPRCRDIAGRRAPGAPGLCRSMARVSGECHSRLARHHLGLDDFDSSEKGRKSWTKQIARMLLSSAVSHVAVTSMRPTNSAGIAVPTCRAPLHQTAMCTNGWAPLNEGCCTY